MGFQKIRYNTGDNIVEIKIKDGYGRIIDSWKIMMTDLSQWIDIMKHKYGIGFKKEQKDLDWAMR